MSPIQALGLLYAAVEQHASMLKKQHVEAQQAFEIVQSALIAKTAPKPKAKPAPAE